MNAPMVGDRKVRKRMYKKGKMWVIAGTASAAFLGGMMGAKAVTANADTVANTNHTPATTQSAVQANKQGAIQKPASVARQAHQLTIIQPQKAAAQSSAAMQTADQTAQPAASPTASAANGSQAANNQQGINVDVPHKTLVDDANKAKQDGVDVKQGPTTHETVPASQTASAAQKVANDYNNQDQQIKKADSEQQAINGARGAAADHSKIDSLVNQIKQAGGNVTQTQGKTFSGGVTDGQKVHDEIVSDYNSEVANLQKDLQDQQQANAAYQRALQNYNNQVNEIKKESVSMKGGDSKSINETYKLLGPGITKVTKVDYKDYDSNDKSWNGTTAYLFNFGTNKDSDYNGNLVQVTWTNLPQSWTIGGQHIDAIKATFSDLKSSGNVGGSRIPDLRVFNDPRSGFWYDNSQGVTVSYQFIVNGKLYSFKPKGARFQFGSLDNYTGLSGNNPHHIEKVKLLSPGSVIIPSDSDATNHDGWIYSDNPNMEYKTGKNLDGKSHSAEWAVSGDTLTWQFVTQQDGGPEMSNNSTLVITWGEEPPLPTPPTLDPVKATYWYDQADLPNAEAEWHLTDINSVPEDKKGVEAGATDGSTQSIDGDTVVPGEDITFTLNSSDLPANRTDKITSDVIVDTLDPNFDYQGFDATLDGKDVTKDLTPALTKGADGKWTLTLSWNQDELNQMNADMSSKYVKPTIYLHGKALNGGQKITNTFTEKINNGSHESNTVTVDTSQPQPEKHAENSSGQVIDGDPVMRGDQIIYDIKGDLTGLKNLKLDKDTLAKGLSWTDTMPAGVTPAAVDQMHAFDPSGKDITSDFTFTENGNVITIVSNNPQELLKDYAGSKIEFKLPTTVNVDAKGTLTNTAIQDTFGYQTKSNPVSNPVPQEKPTKDVVADIGNETSLNGKDLSIGETFNYKLNSSTRPANYGGNTFEWGGVDHLDTSHVEYTGVWHVLSDDPITLKDGTVWKTGTDISKYFTVSYDAQTGEFDIHVDQDLMDILNLPANKKVAEGWSLFIQCKAIKAGTVTNVWDESYNGKNVNSNKVTNQIKTPGEPGTPAKPESPASPKAPANPLAPEQVQAAEVPNAPQKQAPKKSLPDTGDSQNDAVVILGLGVLALATTFGLGYRKRKPLN